MNEELKALDNNQTWEIVKLIPRKKVVSCRWVCKIIYKSDVTVEWHKTKVVARGFSQTYGEDYKEPLQLLQR